MLSSSRSRLFATVRVLVPVLTGIDMIWWKQFPKESRMLFEFKEPSDIEKFTLHSDKPFGGPSLLPD